MTWIEASETPSASTGVVAVIVEVNGEIGPGTKVVVPPEITFGEVRVSVFVWATVLFRVQRETPVASVAEQVPKIFPPPETSNWGTTLVTGFELLSSKVMVMVAVATPLAVIPEVAVMEELEIETL